MRTVEYCNAESQKLQNACPGHLTTLALLATPEQLLPLLAASCQLAALAAAPHRHPWLVRLVHADRECEYASGRFQLVELARSG